jgi:hypothetical protein
VQRFRGCSVDTVGHENCDRSRSDASVSGAREERERGGYGDLGRHRLRCSLGHGFRHVHSQLFGQYAGKFGIDIDQHRYDTFADCRHLNLGQFPAKPTDDVSLLDGALAIPKQRGLMVVLGELFGFAAHLVGFDRFAKRRETCAPRLKRTPAGE